MKVKCVEKIMNKHKEEIIIFFLFGDVYVIFKHDLIPDQYVCMIFSKCLFINDFFFSRKCFNKKKYIFYEILFLDGYFVFVNFISNENFCQ